jgi:hypothetical protein
MPYIKPEERASIDNLLAFRPVTPGELNYAITKLVNEYVTAHGKNYATLNAVVGALECAKQEFYRRVVAPYETQKALENSDVYPR